VVPNPFAPEREMAAIAYVLESDASVAIEIFTLLGDRVWSRAITAGDVGGRAGLNEVAWDGRNTAGQPVRNGVYHCRIRGGDVDRMVKIAAIR
jgi:flagellar hook assembly protein FlgD